MNMHVIITDTGGAPRHQFSLHDFAFLELRAARAYLDRRVKIATIKQEYGLLSREELDALVEESHLLLADIELWKAYQ